MKKFLLLAGVATLITGAAQAGELELGIEGSASVYGVYVNQESSVERAEFGIKKEIELNFTGEVELDSGLTVGASMQISEEDGGYYNNIQENYIFVEGGFGKAIIGQEYNAAYLMQVAAPAVDAELDGMDPVYSVVDSDGTGISDGSYAMYGDGLEGYNSGYNNAGGDKITYISPIFSGLQLGASYTPETYYVSNHGVNDADKADSAYSIAGRYAAEDVLGADWTIGAGYNETVFDGDDQIMEWNVGVNAKADAWTTGAAFYRADDEEADEETEALALGVNYENGAFVYGASYLAKEVFDGSTKDELNRYMAGVNYTYGPGMTLNGSVAFNELKDSTDSHDATVVAVGTVINF